MTGELQRITYVEDDADIAAMVRLCLCDVGGYELQVCGSAAAALAEAPAFQPDLILMDMRLPDMDGLEASARLKKAAGLENVPVVYMTARADDDATARYMENGALGVIAKPFDPMQLASDIAALWECRPAIRAA